VKKDSPNKGKRFYTCQDNPKKCDFFLWFVFHPNGISNSPTYEHTRLRRHREEEAMKRERDAVLLYNSRSENGVTTSVRAKTPEPAPPLNLAGPKAAALTISQYFDRPGAPKRRIFQGADAPRQDRPSESSDTDDDGVSKPSQTLHGSSSSKSPSSNSRSRPGEQAPRPGRAADPVTPAAKRKRSVFLDDDSNDDLFGGDDLYDSETERQLAAITDESARKQQRTRDAYDNTSKAHGGLPTPTSRRPGLLIGHDERERSAKRQRQADSPSGLGEQTVWGNPETPTPYRKTDALVAGGAKITTPETARETAAPVAAEDFPRIADEVMEMIYQQPVSESTKRTLRLAMERHEARVRGVVRGRDAARAIIAERDARIATLQERVVALENSRNVTGKGSGSSARGC
jgi:hypothetical protein